MPTTTTQPHILPGADKARLDAALAHFNTLDIMTGYNPAAWQVIPAILRLSFGTGFVEDADFSEPIPIPDYVLFRLRKARNGGALEDRVNAALERIRLHTYCQAYARDSALQSSDMLDSLVPLGVFWQALCRELEITPPRFVAAYRSGASPLLPGSDPWDTDDDTDLPDPRV